MNAVVKPKKCRVCRREFLPARPLQACCQYSCAITYARLGGEKRQSAATKRVRLAEAAEQKAARLELLRKSIPLSKLKSQAQHEFNRYVRERDFADGCISCHMPASYAGQWHAGHYRTTAAAAHLRYSEDNCHKQCAQCNDHKSGNIVAYRPRLIAKIGLARVELLEDDNRTVRWERDELIAIRKHYLNLWKTAKAAREAM